MSRLIKEYDKVIEELQLKELLGKTFINNNSRAKRTLKRLIAHVLEGSNKYAKMQLKQYYKIFVEENKEIKTRCGNLIILPYMMDKKISLYNGKIYCPIKIKKEMIGKYLGEFITTRTKGAHSAKGQSGDKIKR